MNPPAPRPGIPIASLLDLPGIARIAASELNRRRAVVVHQSAATAKRRAKNKTARASRRTNRGQR